MELSAKESESLSAFVREHLAVENGSDPPEGRFTFDQGRSRREAKKAMEPVPFGEPERTAALVQRKVRDLYARKEGSIWVSAYHTGSETPEGRLCIKAPNDEATSGIDTSRGEVAALVAGNLEALRLVLGDNENLRARLSQHHEFALTMTERFTIEHVGRVLAESNNSAANMQAALEALKPTIEAVLPVAIARLAGGAATLPEEPRERIKAAMGAIVANAQAVFEALQKAPDLGKEPALFKPFRDLCLQAGPALGLKVTEGA